jgi:tyrosyl-tRNA synthetase
MSRPDTPPDPHDVAAEAAALQRGSVDCLPAGALEHKCAAARQRGEGLRVKLGIDPTARDIHLGHTVVLRKLRDFQDRGHKVVLIVGDVTARVGDPSGRSELRPILSDAEIEANAASYQEQALKILRDDPSSLEVRRNSEWLDMALPQLMKLLASSTVAQLIERDDFQKRLAANQPISMLEMLYPLLQGYDSVAVAADVEIGGTDQKFNLLMGRDIQRAYGQDGQAILTMPILVGTDGKRKMSKSLGNHIGVSETPAEIYGKTLSIPDDAIATYYELLLATTAPVGLSARESKRALARALVAWLYSDSAAEEAEQDFDRRFVAKEPPLTMPELELDADVTSGSEAHMPAVIARAFGVSRSEARRLLSEGAVSLDQRRLGGDDLDLPAASLHDSVLQAGKRRFVKLRLAP